MEVEPTTNSSPACVATRPGPTQCARPGCEIVIQAPHVKKRDEDGVPVKVQAYCSDACRMAHWDLKHPRINRPGVEPEAGDGPIKLRIRALLESDGHQRTTADIAFVLRVSEATAARELRKLKAEMGAPVQMARIRGPRRPAVYWIPKAQA